MDYAKRVGTKPKEKETSSQQTIPDNRTEEQKQLLDYLKNLRISETKSSRDTENTAGQGPPSHQRSNKFGRVIGGLSKRLKALKILEKEETPEERKERLQNALSKFDSPFIWKPVYSKFTYPKETVLTRLQDKDDEIVDERAFKWRNFILRLVISYELFLAGRLPEALEAVFELEKILIKNTDTKEWLFLGIKDALWHVVITSKAFLYLEQNQLEEAELMVDHVQPVRTMRLASRAGIHGIRAAVFMEYGHEGNVKALPEAKTASKLDTKTPEWHFLVAKCMGRIRRVANCHDPVDVLEHISINKAAKLDENNPLYKVYLAQIIRERAFRSYKKDYPAVRSEDRSKLERSYRAARYMYREALEMRPNCPHMLTRCAYGSMKLPLQYVDLKFVRESLEKAVELAPNNMMAHHVKGIYHERFAGDAEEAVKEVGIAAALGNSSASFDLIRMRFRLNKGDTIQELEEVARTYTESKVVQVAFAQAGSFMLFIKFNLVAAIKYFTKVIDIDMNSYAMKSHKSLFLRMKDPINLFQVLLAELDQNTQWGSFIREDAMVLKKFRIRIMEHDTLEGKENRLTLAKLLVMSRTQVDLDFDKNEKWKRKQGKRKAGWTGRKWKKRKKSEKKTGVENKDGVLSVKQQENANRKSKTKDSSLKPRQQSRSTSVSSVDSDYQRDGLLHGPRGFFNNSNENVSHDSNIISTDVSNLTGRFSEHLSRLESFRSRASSVSSLDTEDEIGGRPSDFQSQIDYHSKCLNHNSIVNRTEETVSKISLSMENLNLCDSAQLDVFRARKPSISSMEFGSTERLSVMDRVKQSYAMLSRPSNQNNQREKKNRRRSESVQSSNKQHKKDSALQRSDSTQSLNVEVDALRTKLEAYKPFGSKDSSVGSNLNFFMPSFAQKK